MNTSRLWLSAALAGLTVSAFAAEYAPGQVLVKFRAGMEQSSRGAHALVGAQLMKTIPAIRWQVIRIPGYMSVPDAVRYYKGLGTVEAAEPNYIYRRLFTPNDTRFAEQWGPKKVSLPAAWDLDRGRASTIIAILDTGVDYNHEDLVGKVIKGHDYADGDEDPMDPEGHGTHVAGIAAANTNNARGVAGAGFDSKILAIRVLGPGGGTADWVAEGTLEAQQKGANIINLSLGGAAGAQVMEDAINLVWSRGVLVVAASGNNGVTDRFYPAAYEKAIAVASSAPDDSRSGFSNYGSDWVDVAAPGQSILSTFPGNNYGESDGTSMACPLASGVLGIMHSYAGPGVSNVDLRKALEESANRVGDYVKFGRINAFEALKRLVKPVTREFTVKRINPYQAASFSGTIASVQSSENQYYKVRSMDQGRLGATAGAEVAINFPSAANYLGGTLHVESNGPAQGTMTVWLYNFTRRTWDTIKSNPVSPVDRITLVNLPANITPYVSGAEVRAVVRTHRPIRLNRQPFEYNIDHIKLSAKFKS